jgi:hypothetical protein
MKAEQPCTLPSFLTKYKSQSGYYSLNPILLLTVSDWLAYKKTAKKFTFL